MLFYKANIHWKSEEEKTGTFCNAENNNYPAALSKHWSKTNASVWNEKLYDAVSYRTTLCFMSEYEPNRGQATIYFGTDNKESAISLLATFKQVLAGTADDADLQWEETTIFEIVKQHKAAERKRYLADVYAPTWNLLDNYFRYERNIITGTEGRESIQKQSVYGFSEVLHQARNSFADDSFREEIERIYSDKNPKKFYGIPIHYDFCFTASNTAKKLLSLLSQALLENGRLLGRRITTVSFYKLDLQNDEDKWEELETVCRLANGTMLVIDFTDNDSNTRIRRRPAFLNAISEKTDEEVLKRFFRLMEKYHQKTLFVLLENPQQGILKKYSASESMGLSFLQFVEQIKDRVTALKFLAHLLEESNVKDFVPKDWENILTEQEHYTAESVTHDFNSWYSHALQDLVYTAYHGCLQEKSKLNETTDNYAKLQNMVGLKEIKQIIDTILADYQIKKMRQEAGLISQRKSLHMLFTGNPGSAKTTCARLLAGILKDRGLLASGEFVECGIVQEMENHRDDVIVIFAGYPEPMEDFLKANEGLRSRIAFHLNFPDYNADEMTEIFALMMKEQGYTCSKRFLAKAYDLFAEAVTHVDFGNGRFARNLLEQSIMKQSARLIHLAERTDTPSQPLHRKDLITLLADDLAVESVQNYRVEKPSIGFR